MQKQNIQTLKGFRDFLPEEKNKRDYVKTKITQVFENFGFLPLETPTLEYAELLMGKYGDEADKLVYNFEDRGGRQVALRYDQTVPSARVLSQYQNQLPIFFRRYQIQNVFRADKPQKGRYREFTQCDIDIFNTNSPIADGEILACSYLALKNIGFKNIELKINDRKTLIETLSPFVNPKVDVFSIIQSIDKLDKISPQQVIEELVSKGLDKSQAEQALDKLQNAEMSDNLAQIVQIAQGLGVAKNDLKFTPTLARGLDYYTGMIFEIKIPEFAAGSVGGGGRYDQLIGQLSGTEIKATGFAFGFDRVVEIASELGLLSNLDFGPKVLVSLFDEQFLYPTLQIAKQLRQAGIKTEIYPQFDKLAKQFKLANQKNIPYVIIIGEQEIQDQTIALKDMSTGVQSTLTLNQLIKKLK